MQGSKRDTGRCYAAASAGHADCLRYAHERGHPWQEGAAEAAARNGNLACLTYACENGCPLSKDLTDAAAGSGSIACLRYTYQLTGRWTLYVCANAVFTGDLDVLRCARDLGCPWGNGTCMAACHVPEHLDVDDMHYGALLRYLVVGGCPPCGYLCTMVASLGLLDVLVCARALGGPWDELTCGAAAAGNHLDCLRYAHENECPWDEATTVRAACHGSLDCLRYAHENGCPWDQQTCRMALEHRHVDCLRYMLDSGWPGRTSRKRTAIDLLRSVDAQPIDNDHMAEF